METKANYIAVGTFVLICVIGVVVAVMWLAGLQYSQEFVYYQTYFTGSVTGLGKGTTVRYNGIEVGRVDSLTFDPNDPQRVITTLAVQPGLNIREDSRASIETLGLAGGSYVEITGGSASSPILVAKSGERYPVIKEKAAAFAQIEESAGLLVNKLNVAADRLNDVLSDQNRTQIKQLLANLNQTLANLNQTSATLAARRGDIDKTLHNLAEASDRLTPMVANANTTLNKFGTLADDADVVVRSPAFSDLPEITADLKKLLASVTKLSDQLDREPTQLLFGDRRKGYAPK